MAFWDSSVQPLFRDFLHTSTLFSLSYLIRPHLFITFRSFCLWKAFSAVIPYLLRAIIFFSILHLYRIFEFSILKFSKNTKNAFSKCDICYHSKIISKIMKMLQNEFSNFVSKYFYLVYLCDLLPF